MSPAFSNPNDALRYHVTGAIERGEGTPIVEQTAPKGTVVMVDTFFDGYVACALWTATDEGLDATYTVEDFTEDAITSMMAECSDFYEANRVDLIATGASDARNGHDFWLTRNGHGTGFWDRGYGAVGDRLKDAAKVYGESYVMPNGTDLEVM